MNYHHHRVVCVVLLFATLSATSVARADDKAPIIKTFTEGTKDFLSDRARTGSLIGTILFGAAVANPLAPIVGSVAGYIIGKNSEYSNIDSRAARRQAYFNRKLTPAEGTQVASLTGLTGQATQAPDQTTAVQVSEKTGRDYELDRVESLVTVPSPAELVTTTRPGHIEPSLAEALPHETVVIAEDAEPTEPSISKEIPSRRIIGDVPVELEPILLVKTAGQINTRTRLQKQLAEECDRVQRTQALSLRCYYFSQ